MLKKAAITIAGLLTLATAFFFFRFTVLLPRDIPTPDVTLPRITSDEYAATIERGRYLANHVAVCMDCHSTRNWQYYAGPIVEGTLGQGGEVFDQSTGLPGVIVAKNITPHSFGSRCRAPVYVFSFFSQVFCRPAHKCAQSGARHVLWCAKTVSMKRGRARHILDEVLAVFSNWSNYADEAGVPEEMMNKIQNVLRVSAW